jgi:hypothetical protein
MVTLRKVDPPGLVGGNGSFERLYDKIKGNIFYCDLHTHSTGE